MAEVKKTDLAEKDVLAHLIPTDVQLKLIQSLNKELEQLAVISKQKISQGNATDLKTIKEQAQAQKLLNDLTKQKIQIEKAETDLKAKLRKEQEAVIRNQQRAAKAAKDEGDEYKKLSTRLNDLRGSYKNLAVQGKENTREAREMLKEITRLDSGLKRVDATVGQHQRSVGNYSNALSGAKSALMNFGIALSGVAIARDAINVVRDFEQANATLAAVLGTTTENTKDLQEQQKQLGASTSFTAAQVGELQTELAKLGFTQGEIKQATEGVLMLAKAAGTDLANAAAIAGSTLRGFGLEADQMGRVTDVMAKSFSTSALDVDKFKESMKLVAPIANSAGVSLEETTAMLGALANAGISGSNAGTALRRILSEVATTGKPVAQAMAEMAEKGMDLADAEDEVGKNAMSALLILNNSNEQIKELTHTYENAAGSAKEMSEVMDNTLNGALARLRSAWEGQILALNDTANGASAITKVINFLANNIGVIVKVVGTALTGFLAWKATMIATRVATTAYASAVQLMGIVMAKTAVQTKTADVAMDNFNKTTKANPLGLLISLLATAVTAFISFADTASAAEKAQNNLNNAIESGRARGAASAERLKAAEDKLFEGVNRQAQIMLNQGAKQVEVDAFVLREKQRIVAMKIELAEQEMQKTEDQRAAYVKAKKQEIQALDEQIARLEEQGNMENSAVRARLSNLRATQREAQEAIKTSKAKSDAHISALRMQVKETKETHEVLMSEEVKHQNDMTDAMKTAAKKRQEELNILRRRLEDMQDASIEDEFTRRQQQLKRALDRELEAIKGNSQVEIDLRLELQRKFEKDSEALYLEYRKKRLSYAEDYLKMELEAEQNHKLMLEKEFSDQDTLFEKRHKERLLDALTNSQMTAEQVAEIERQSEIQLLEEKIALRKLYGKDTLDLEIDLANKRKQVAKDEVKQEFFTAEERKQILQSLTDFANRQTDERIRAIDREMDAAKRQYDYYAELAAQGNITAEQSLLEQNRIIEQAEREKEQLERRKQQIQLISSGLATYQNKANAGDKNPLVSTITEITLLTQFLQNLPAFFKGTEDTGAGGGLDGKGGFGAILHPHERVVPASENAKLTGISNSELADVGHKWKTGQLIHVGQKSDSSGKSWEVGALIKKFDELKDVMANQPQTDWNIGEVTSNSFNLIKRTVAKNTVIYNKYRMK